MKKKTKSNFIQRRKPWLERKCGSISKIFIAKFKRRIYNAEITNIRTKSSEETVLGNIKITYKNEEVFCSNFMIGGEKDLATFVKETKRNASKKFSPNNNGVILCLSKKVYEYYHRVAIDLRERNGLHN